MTRILALVILAFAGAAVAIVGAGTHRSYPPIGLVLVVLLVLATAVFARSWQGWWGLGLFGGVWAVAVYLLAQTGPGNSVLIVQDTYGYVFAFGGAVAIVLVCMIPPTWIRGRRNVEA